MTGQPDISTNKNGEINPSDNLSPQKTPSSINGNKSVCSTDNVRHSSPGISKETYKLVVEKTIDDTVTEKPHTASFHILKSIYDIGLFSLTEESDDATVDNESELISRRFSMTYVVSGTKKRIDDEEAPLEAIRCMNEMVKSLIDECPSVKFGPLTGPYSKSNPLLKVFPEDVDTVEICVYEFN